MVVGNWSSAWLQCTRGPDTSLEMITIRRSLLHPICMCTGWDMSMHAMQSSLVSEKKKDLQDCVTNGSHWFDDLHFTHDQVVTCSVALIHGNLSLQCKLFYKRVTDIIHIYMCKHCAFGLCTSRWLFNNTEPWSFNCPLWRRDCIYHDKLWYYLTWVYFLVLALLVQPSFYV